MPKSDELPSVCFVTPSYAGDLERCRLLVQSRRICAPDIDHYIIVDAPDVPRFATLADDRTIIVDTRELLDAELHKLWGDNGWWFGRRVLPMRGWITQQLRKLAMPRITNVDVLVNIDSDVVFIRPFHSSLLFEAGNLSLFEVDYRNAEVRNWSRQAAILTGVQPPTSPNNYVGMMISWKCDILRNLTDRVEEQAGIPWQIALGRKRSFSEYMMYGTFVRYGPGLEECGHFSDARKLVETSWHRDTTTREGLTELFAKAPSEAVAVMVHSKDGIDPATYSEIARHHWAQI